MGEIRSKARPGNTARLRPNWSAVAGMVVLLGACTAAGPTVEPTPSIEGATTSQSATGTTKTAPTSPPTASHEPSESPFEASVPTDRATTASFPEQPEGTAWPTVEWTTAELPDGVDEQAIERASDRAFADGGPQRVRAVLVVHGGAIVYERYSPSSADGPGVTMPGASIAKSVTAALVGILVDDGRLSLDQPAPVPEWHEDPSDPRAAITLEHMLHMSTGMDWSDGLEAGTTMSAMVASDNMGAYAASQTPDLGPGRTVRLQHRHHHAPRTDHRR